MLEITSGQRAVVAGMGRSAVGAVKLLLSRGVRPFVTDYKDDSSLSRYRQELEKLGVAYEVGGHTDSAFNADFAVISPGVPADLAPLAGMRSRGLPVIGELELAARFCSSKILAVTGTNGKTTTTELLRSLVAASGHTVALAGNNDTPFSLIALQDPAPEYVVLEVSSYQLETVFEFHPWIAVALNVTPDHLGRHRTMEEYAAVKARIFARQGLGDAAVVNLDDLWCARMDVPEAARRVGFSLQERPVDGLWVSGDRIREGDRVVALLSDNPLPGRHNLANVLAALAMVRAGGFDWEKALSALRSFRGVEHRIEYVAERDGVAYYNDSKSTNIDSLRVALESFERPLILIAGGRGKGSDYRVLRDLVRNRVKRMVTLGEDASLLEAAFGGVTFAERACDMRDAVYRASRAASPGDAVLLSPACASFDMYRNFEERGHDFKECVRRILEDNARKTEDA